MTDNDAALIAKAKRVYEGNTFVTKLAERLAALVAELEVECNRRFEGNRISSDEHRVEIVSLKAELAEANTQKERFELFALQIRKALTGNIHGHEDLLEVIAAIKAELEEVKAVIEGVSGVTVEQWNKLVKDSEELAALKAQSEPVAEFHDDGSDLGTVRWLPNHSVMMPGDKLFKAPQPSAEVERDAALLNRIAWLIGSIFVHGNFVAETGNERELEKLLREVGCFWESLEEFDAAMRKGE